MSSCRGWQLLILSVMIAHFCICLASTLQTASPECWLDPAPIVGDAEMPDTVQARQAAAAALKCWVDRDEWQPALLPTIFSSGSHALFSAPLITAQVGLDLLLRAPTGAVHVLHLCYLFIVMQTACKKDF